MSSSNDLQLGGSVRKMTGPVVGSKYHLKVLIKALERLVISLVP